MLVSGRAWLHTAQVAVFALGAFAGPRFAPYSVLYRSLVAPRPGPPTERADAAPVRFSQLVGLVFAVVGYLTGLIALGVVATAFALAAALRGAAFGFCLGCELYAVIANQKNRHSRNNKQGATS